MGNNIYYIFAFITLTVSLLIIIMALVRLHCGECKRARMKYTFVLLAALAAGLQPYFFKQLPGVSNMLLVISILWLLVDGALSLKEHKKSHLRGCADDANEVGKKSEG